MINLKNIKGPLVLGIHWSHDASVTICSDEGVHFAVAEERISRIKHHYGFPILSIAMALTKLGITAKDISIVAMTTRKPLFPFHDNHISVGLDGEISGPGLTAHRKWYPGLKHSGKKIKVPGPKAKDKFKGTAWEGFEDRHWSYHHDALNELGLFDPAIRHVYVAHHRAHAASTFRLAGKSANSKCVVTLDGKGDNCSGTISIGHPDGQLELVRNTAAEQSMGSFYQAVTEALGFVPVDGEYKTMGLAALGKPGLTNPFADTIKVVDGRTESKYPWSFRSFNEHCPEKKVPNPLSSVAETLEYVPYLDTYEPTQIAYFAQEHLEENMLKLIDDAMRITKCRELCTAGGVMLNVKANSRIRDELKPESFFVFPDSADSGLAVGAALEAAYLCGLGTVMDLKTPYLGYGFDDSVIQASLAAYSDLDVQFLGEKLPKTVAHALMDGMVLGTFQGRMEMGPRALGNRSVIADPRHAKVKDRINDILKGREWFVPFAPMVLEDEAHRYWDGRYDYRYMTFAVEANDYAKERVPGVVHMDGTMRPQVVTAATNPWVFEVLNKFRDLSGVGVLINTSFNRHGLPIVGQPEDAIEHLRQGWVDALAMGGFFVKRTADHG